MLKYRPNYEDAVQLAKKQRKELKRSEAKIEKEQFTQNETTRNRCRVFRRYYAK